MGGAGVDMFRARLDSHTPQAEFRGTGRIRHSPVAVEHALGVPRRACRTGWVVQSADERPTGTASAIAMPDVVLPFLPDV